MPRIDFYHDAPDRLRTAARIVHKAFAQGCEVVVYSSDQNILGNFDKYLWLHPATGFVPHCRADSPLAGETPVLLADDMTKVRGDDVLINLDAQVPPQYSRFRRLIDIIGSDEEEKTPGRERFRVYRESGFEFQRHDLSERQ